MERNLKVKLKRNLNKKLKKNLKVKLKRNSTIKILKIWIWNWKFFKERLKRNFEGWRQILIKLNINLQVKLKIEVGKIEDKGKIKDHFERKIEEEFEGKIEKNQS